MDQYQCLPFSYSFIKMTSYNIYPPIPSAPSIRAPDAPPQVGYHLNMILAKRRGLIAKEKMFKKKYEMYTEILNRLMRLNACLSGISIATGISRVATFNTFIGIPVNAVLGVASMTGAIGSGIISVLTKDISRNLRK